jgi:RNA polymerase sigma-70 factor (ECF subfamily)
MQRIYEAKMDVATLLSTLPDAERIVTLLFYLDDIPINKISKITGMPEGTVKSHLSRARNHMATKLKR